MDPERTGGLRKPAGRQCGFRHHLALSSIVQLFHSVKWKFCGLAPLAYAHRRARAGSRPPPVAALALALTLPGNGGRAPARRTGHQRRSAPGPRAPHTARGPPPGHQTRTRGPSAPEGGTRRPTDPRKGGPRPTAPAEGGERGGSRDHRHPPGGARPDRARGAATSPAALWADGKGPAGPAARAKPTRPPPSARQPARGEFQWSRLPLWVGRDAPGRGDQPPSEGPGSRPSRAGGPGGELTHCRGPEIPAHRFAETFVR